MLRRALPPLLAVFAAAVAAIAAAAGFIVLPNGWRLSPPPAAVIRTGTMPQGLALSPDGKMLAVVESGVNPAALRLLSAPDLRSLNVIPLRGAFGTPVWRDATHVLVAGANTDSVLTVDISNGAVTQSPSGKDSWPAAVAMDDAGDIAIADDGEGAIVLNGTRIPVPAHPADVVFSGDGKTLYACTRSGNDVLAVDVRSKTVVSTIAVGKHPGALALDGNTLYVAESDDDAVGVIDTRTRKKIADIPVGIPSAGGRAYGASPNALAVRAGRVYVSLGGENAIAVIAHGAVAERIPAGWYPTGVAVANDGTIYVSNGKGEGAPANPQFDPFRHDSPGYVGSITVGSVRAIPSSSLQNADAQTAAVAQNVAPRWTPAPPAETVVRPGGPIKHVIYVIKENRSYDEVLGDVTGANGDPKLVYFGRTITPNQHAIAQRFGVFDNAYADAQVSADGHNWTDAGFANDYVERFWPDNYGDRREVYDMQDGTAPDVPHSGYIWDAAARAHVTFRDYGEDIDFPGRGIPAAVNTFPGLRGHFDPAYIGWDFDYSDLARFAEWSREFSAYTTAGTLPQLEIVYLPNDHTFATVPGKLTPQAYVATNDWALGKLVDAVSHSRYWRSTAIFILEDDAQNGPDHVSDQRSTFYLASPYAKGGVHHEHYSTVSVVHSIELLLGLPALSIYDRTAQPMYAAFATRIVNAEPYTAVRPGIDLNAVNTKAAYDAALSAKLDFTHPDAVDPALLNDILEHAVRK